MKNMLIRIILFVSVIAGCFGCAAVSPKARKLLGDPIMRINRDPAGKSLDNHIFERREGSSGGTEVSNGGCGC